MLLLVSVILSTGRGSLYDVTSSLTAWSHVPSRESLSLVPCSFQGGGSVSGPMFIQRGGLCLWSHVPSGGLIDIPAQRPPSWTETLSPWFGKEWAVRILLECILVPHKFAFTTSAHSFTSCIKGNISFEFILSFTFVSFSCQPSCTDIRKSF